MNATLLFTQTAAAEEMYRQADAEIARAIGPLALNMNWVREHCRIVIRADDPERIETFCVDGVPVLEFYPFESEMVNDGNVVRLRITRKVRRIAPPPEVSKGPQERKP